MKMILLRLLNTCHVLAVFSMLGFIDSARADSWAPPSEFDTLSESGKFIAHVIPGKKDLKPLLIVSSIDTGKTNEIWRAELSNPISPTEVHVTDDGNSVVTFDNYFGVGYGDDVVALYNSKGQLAKYSLEEFAPPPQTRTNNLVERLKEKLDALRNRSGFSTRMAYHDLFSHSTSSRWWNEASIQFFWPSTN